MSLKSIAFGCLCAGLAAAHAAGNEMSASVQEGAWFAPTLRMEGGTVEVTFGMDEGARVSLVAFDARGRALATLIDGQQPSGYHHLSVFSNRLQGQDGRIYFQLRAGNAVLAELRPRAIPI